MNLRLIAMLDRFERLTTPGGTSSSLTAATYKIWSVLP